LDMGNLFLFFLFSLFFHHALSIAYVSFARKLLERERERSQQIWSFIWWMDGWDITSF
jgi:hypothetical protein